MKVRRSVSEIRGLAGRALHSDVIILFRPQILALKDTWNPGNAFVLGNVYAVTIDVDSVELFAMWSRLGQDSID